ARLIFAWHGFAGEAQAGARQEGAEAVRVGPGSFPGLAASAAPGSGGAGRDDGDLAVLLYTSGTPGSPTRAGLTRAALARNANLARNGDVVRTDLLQLTPSYFVFGRLPLFHSFGQTCALNAVVTSGACIALLPRFAPDRALEIPASHRATIFEGVPTMYVTLL